MILLVLRLCSGVLFSCVCVLVIDMKLNFLWLCSVNLCKVSLCCVFGWCLR